MEDRKNKDPGTAHRNKSSLSRKSIGLMMLISGAFCFYVLAMYIDIVPAILPSPILDQGDSTKDVSEDPGHRPEASAGDIVEKRNLNFTKSLSEDVPTAAAVTNKMSAINATTIRHESKPDPVGLLASTTVSNSPTISGVIASELLRKPEMTGQCDRLPFLACEQTSQNVSLTKQFRVAMLRRPSSWLPGFNFRTCEYSNCLFDDTQVTENTDLVIVYAGGLKDNYSPPKRWPHQRYVAAVWESPPHTSAQFLYDNNSVWNHVFNLTATYRTDSDIFIPYSRLRFRPKPLKERPDYIEIAKLKNKTAAWFVSNCQTPSRRREYVREMQKYIDVDIYGACGQPCSKDNPQCLAQLTRQYKFYLSFENSICTDYVTEKLFKLFEPDMHIVPVVRGGANYDQHLPKNTVVNAGNFKTAKDLALHLRALAVDLKVYSKLLEYKDMFRSDPTQGIDGMACIVCKFLNTKPYENKVYDMKSWMGDNHCKQPSDIT